jgi:nucleoporin GLE1
MELEFRENDLSLKAVISCSFQCQGPSIVSKKLDTVLACGAVIEAVWADFPDFGQLVLGHFHKQCPYLVPIFLPQVEGQSNEDYYK